MFFALLLLGGLLGLVVTGLNAPARASVAAVGLPLAAVVAVGATTGSLYFSEVAGFVPCELCWFQRIAMYPLAVVLPIAAVRNDASILRYAQVLAGIGLVIALYHSQLQAFPSQSSFCELTNPCTSSPITTLRWVTIPHMSAASFLVIGALAGLARTVDPNRRVQ